MEPSKNFMIVGLLEMIALWQLHQNWLIYNRDNTPFIRQFMVNSKNIWNNISKMFNISKIWYLTSHRIIYLFNVWCSLKGHTY